MITLLFSCVCMWLRDQIDINGSIFNIVCDGDASSMHDNNGLLPISNWAFCVCIHLYLCIFIYMCGLCLCLCLCVCICIGLCYLSAFAAQHIFEAVKCSRLLTTWFLAFPPKAIIMLSQHSFIFFFHFSKTFWRTWAQYTCCVFHCDTKHSQTMAWMVKQKRRIDK